MIWIALDPCFVFQTANAYDLPDGRIVLDVVAYERMFSDENDGPDSKPRSFERRTIDPIVRTVVLHMIDATPQELLRIDERRTGQPTALPVRWDCLRDWRDAGRRSAAGQAWIRHTRRQAQIIADLDRRHLTKHRCRAIFSATIRKESDW